ncbi:MAG: hypothetical protein QW291_06835 [Thermofilaceae archaeon]
MESFIEKRFKKYKEKCKKEEEIVEEMLGYPHITLNIRLPDNCENLADKFINLPNDLNFIKELEKFIKEYLIKSKNN